MDKDRFVSTMVGLAENFQVDLSTGFLDMIYKSACKDGFTIEQWISASEKLLREHKYKSFPVYADFYQAIRGTALERAEKEASLIIDSIRKGNDIEFTDPVTKHIMSRRWNIDRLRETMIESEEKWFIKDFKETYIAYANTAVAVMLEDQTPKKIQEMCEQIGNQPLHRASRCAKCYRK